MDTEDLQRNFEGYLNTPLLWQGTEVYNFQQCVLRDSLPQPFNERINTHLRLGKLVERFVSQELSQSNVCEILAENIQIQDGKRTIGELDALIMLNNKPIHLEIIYKFYLYDPNEGHDELSHWIGPNRKDSLLEKLDKLKNKQLPLLYHSKTQPFLERLKINRHQIEQKVLFKAQLFLPLDYDDQIFFLLNQECVEGFYLKKENLYKYKTSKFYIPKKINWLMPAHPDVEWLDYTEFTSEIDLYLDKKMAPLCWSDSNGGFQKFFVVWW